MKHYTLREPEYATRKIDYESHLNEQQLAVVKAGAGPLLVIAGAGSGKTHTLTHRMAYLVEKGVAPERVMLLTFTNRAARAMTGRAAGLIGIDTNQMWGGTFHSIANRILRVEAARLSYPDDFTIIDFEDSTTLMKACLSDADVGHRDRRFPSTKVLCRIYSFCINTRRTIEEVLDEHYPYFIRLADELRKVFMLFQTRKLEMGLMDFDDLLLNWRRLLTDHEDLRQKYAGQFEHILVDEYQDTNHLQGEIVDLMASVHGNVMVVGDDCQSIYAFRGANYRNILEFPKRFPNCEQFRLEINYRSTPQILNLANRSIAHNRNQFQKTLRAQRREGPRPAFVRLKDANQQAKFVCQRILDLVDEGRSLDKIAVLYRSHHHSMELQVEMARCGIAFIVRSGMRFFEQAHIKDMLAYLRFLFNPKDELAFMRLTKQWYGVGQKRAQDIWLFLNSQPDVLEATVSPKLLEVLPKRAAASWKQAAELLSQLRRLRLSHGPAEMIEVILKSDYGDYLQSNYDKAENRTADIEQLASYSAQFATLDEFLGEISLLASISGQEIAVGNSAPDTQVCLSSIHQAKGLEWDACFVLWLSDGQFPHQSAADDNDQLEEERRLFYVAATRARDELYLCHPFTHMGRDRFTVVLRESPFIRELQDFGRDAVQPYEEWSITPPR